MRTRCAAHAVEDGSLPSAKSAPRVAAWRRCCPRPQSTSTCFLKTRPTQPSFRRLERRVCAYRARYAEARCVPLNHRDVSGVPGADSMPTPAHEHRGSHLSWTTVPNRPPLFFARAEAPCLDARRPANWTETTYRRGWREREMPLDPASLAPG